MQTPTTLGSLYAVLAHRKTQCRLALRQPATRNPYVGRELIPSQILGDVQPDQACPTEFAGYQKLVVRPLAHEVTTPRPDLYLMGPQLASIRSTARFQENRPCASE